MRVLHCHVCHRASFFAPAHLMEATLRKSITKSSIAECLRRLRSRLWCVVDLGSFGLRAFFKAFSHPPGVGEPHWAQGLEFKVGLGLWVWGYRVWDFRAMVEGLGLKGLGFGALGCGFRVEG